MHCFAVLDITQGPRNAEVPNFRHTVEGSTLERTEPQSIAEATSYKPSTAFLHIGRYFSANLRIASWFKARANCQQALSSLDCLFPMHNGVLNGPNIIDIQIKFGHT